MEHKQDIETPIADDVLRDDAHTATQMSFGWTFEPLPLDEAMRLARDAADFSAFVVADAAFHLALVHAAGNQILAVFYDNLFGLITEVIQITSRVPTKSLESAYAEHADIFHLIEARDVAGAKALMRAQIDNSAAYLRVAIEKAKNKDNPDE